MKKWIALVAVGASLAVTGGCSTMSSEEYSVVQTELRKPSSRREATALCMADVQKRRAVDKTNMAALLGVSVKQTPYTFCNRFFAAIANGRLTYEDYVTANRTGNIAPYLRVLRG